MSSSLHHIQITRYNRRLQYTPMDRVGNRNKAMIKYLEGKVKFSINKYDNRSFVERKSSRNKFNNTLSTGVLLGVITLTVILLLMWDIIFALF